MSRCPVNQLAQTKSDRIKKTFGQRETAVPLKEYGYKPIRKVAAERQEKQAIQSI